MNFTRFELFWLCSIVLCGALMVARTVWAVRNPRWTASPKEKREGLAWCLLSLLLWSGLVAEFATALFKKGV